MFAFFLLSGLFLGWSLGANDAANVFGTAVGSRMISFKKAAIFCGIFVIFGSVISGAGASETLGKLGGVNAIGGAFVVAFAAGISVYLMTVAGYPVSTTQAIVGGIIGYNLFTGSLIDYNSLATIISTWVLSPVLTAIFSIILYKIVSFYISHRKIHMFTLDARTRFGLILVGVFGSYSLGASNIANVMGVFVPVSPFSDISLFEIFKLTAAQQLFLIGGIAIAIGVLTYSKKVIMTVGASIFEISPVAAFVVVLAESIVLFLFASQGLESLLIRLGLPTIPLVPVSSSQAVVGGVIGIGLLKGARAIQWGLVGRIAASWVFVPLIAALISLTSLFFMQNVFQQRTYLPVKYFLTSEAVERVQASGVDVNKFKDILGKEFPNAVIFKGALSEHLSLTSNELDLIMTSAEIDEMKVAQDRIARIPDGWITWEQKKVLEQLIGRAFVHSWMLDKALSELSKEWQFRQGEKAHNEELKRKLAYIHKLFRVNQP